MYEFSEYDDDKLKHSHFVFKSKDKGEIAYPKRYKGVNVTGSNSNREFVDKIKVNSIDYPYEVLAIGCIDEFKINNKVFNSSEDLLKELNRILFKKVGGGVSEYIDLRIGGRNLFYGAKCERNKWHGYLGENGAVYSNDNDTYTNYIPIEDYKYLTVKIWELPTSGKAHVAFYKNSKEFIKRVSFDYSKFAEIVVKIPENAYYLRISTPRALVRRGRYKFEFGSKATDYSDAPEDLEERILDELSNKITQKEYSVNDYEWGFTPNVDVKYFGCRKIGSQIMINASLNITTSLPEPRISLFKIPKELNGVVGVSQLVSIVNNGSKSLRELIYDTYAGEVFLEDVMGDVSPLNGSNLIISLCYPNQYD